MESRRCPTGRLRDWLPDHPVDTGVWIEKLVGGTSIPSRCASWPGSGCSRRPLISAYLTANVIDIHHAEDLVQEVAQVVAEKFAEYDRRLVVHVVGAGDRPESAVEVLPLASAGPPGAERGGAKQLGEALERVEHEAEDRRAALRTCLERVRAAGGEVLEMRYGENARVGDIAEQFGMSTDGVSVMLHRIRSVLFDCIQQQLAKSEAQ